MKTRSKHSKKLPKTSLSTQSETDTEVELTSTVSYSSCSSKSNLHPNKHKRTFSDEGSNSVSSENSQLSNTLSMSYEPKEIICRNTEKQSISKFVKECLNHEGTNPSRVLYISGVPGVGKTLSTMRTLIKIKKYIHYTKAIFKYINAMKLKNPSTIYKVINQSLYESINSAKPISNRNIALDLQLKLEQDKKVKIVVIDEVDYLLNRDQSILYNLFEWSNSPRTKLCFIVIANTMDFPQRLMPKITSRMGENRLVFKPYTQKQVQQIIEERLQKSKRFSKDAIVYACKKISSFTSDIRKILQILRMSLEDTDNMIGIDIIIKNWRLISEAQGETWQEGLPTFYQQILNVIKEEGGNATENEIWDRLHAKIGVQMGEILHAMGQLSKMKLIKLCEKRKNHLDSFEATIIKL